MTADDIREEFKHLGEPEPAFINGLLVDVDSERGCAALSIYPDRRIPLRFDSALEKDAIELNQKYVRITGRGWFDEDDNWAAILMEEVTLPPPPLTREEILNDTDPTYIFDPDTVVRASEPFDVDEFLRVIYEGRGRTWKG